MKYSLHLIRGFHRDFAAEFQIKSFQFPSVFHLSLSVTRDVVVQESGGIGGYKSLGYLYVKETGFAIGRWYDFFRIFTREATKYLIKMY